MRQMGEQDREPGGTAPAEGSFLGGNFLAIILAYAVAPTSVAEFPSYVRTTLDRLLLHLTPTAALLVGLGLKEILPKNK